MGDYRGIDFYDIDDLLTEDQRMVRDMIRAFVSAEVVPIIAGHARAGTFPETLIPKLAELNVFGPTLPEEYGCAGLDSTSYGLICQELERGDSAIRSFVSVHSSLGMFAIHRFGTEEQRTRFLPAMARGEKIGCFGLTEPDHGSDPAGMATRARKVAGGWMLNGSKMWITNGGLADVAIVWARTDDGIRGFLVERGMDGFSAPEMKGKLSLRASVTSELVLDNVKVSDENLLPEAKGLAAPLTCLDQARYGIAWGAVGAAQACFDEVLGYQRSRTQFGRPLAAFQLNQQKFADMLTEITKAQMLCYRLGRLKDDGRATAAQVSLAKRNNVAMALEVARTCRGMLGANGILDEYHSMRHSVNLESVYTYEGTHEIHTLVLGAAVTGLESFR